MEKLIDIGNRYVKESDWKTIAVLKSCLLALGMMVGITLPKKHKKAVYLLCAPVFLVCYGMLMLKLVRVIQKEDEV